MSDSADNTARYAIPSTMTRLDDAIERLAAFEDAARTLIVYLDPRALPLPARLAIETLEALFGANELS